MDETHTDVESQENEVLKVGQLYEWNGHELVPIQRSEQVKVPITTEAMDAVRNVRARSTRDGFRPCLMMTASTMLLAAMHQVENLPDQVFDYGSDLYAKLSRKKGRS